MLNASQIKGLIPEGGSLIFNITATKDSKLSVLVNPQCPEKPAPNLSGASGAIKAATAPRLVTGTPEELDNGFMGIPKELTGRREETLFKALRERDFDDIVEGQAEYYMKQGIPGGERRDAFIDEKLWKSLDGDDLDAIRENRPELHGRENKEIKEWLMTYECPVSDEEELIRSWAWERANDDAQCGVLWDHFDHDDDAQTALNMGLVNYLPFVDGKYVDGGENAIPAEAANEIRRLTDEANRIASEYHVICGTDQSKYTEEQRSKRALVDSLWKESAELERKAVERFVLVSGFYCDIHGGRAEYAETIQRSEAEALKLIGIPYHHAVAVYEAEGRAATVEDITRILYKCIGSRIPGGSMHQILPPIPS